VHQGRGEVARLEGRLVEARDLSLQALDGFGALGMRTVAASCTQGLARIELSAGNPAAARDALLQGDAVFAEADEVYFRCTTQAMLARVHELLGAADDALAAVELAERLSAPDDAINYAITHEVRARFALARGDQDVAERWARSAVDHAFRTDWVEVQADAKLGLARVLAACGRRAAARAEAYGARELFEAKGNRPGGATVSAMVAELSASAGR
jgi:tetratricopeptide (TPR) repeat protein